MKIQILTSTSSKMDLLYAAARTCKSKLTPEALYKDAWNAGEAKKIQLLKALWKAGHYSVFEHVNISYAISGISRTCLAQLSRHRFLSMSVQSQRYVDLSFLAESYKLPVTLPPTIKEDIKREEAFIVAIDKIEQGCEELKKLSVPLEDIRYLYPGGTTTNLVLTCNLRTLGELNEKRAQNKAAQWEIRELVQKMVDLVVEDIPWFGECLGGRKKDEDQDQASAGNEAI